MKCILMCAIVLAVAGPAAAVPQPRGGAGRAAGETKDYEATILIYRPEGGTRTVKDTRRAASSVQATMIFQQRYPTNARITYIVQR